eukprot:3852771-Prymnesium_polylepis.1
MTGGEGKGRSGPPKSSLPALRKANPSCRLSGRSTIRRSVSDFSLSTLAPRSVHGTGPRDPVAERSCTAPQVHSADCLPGSRGGTWRRRQEEETAR